MLSLLKYAPTVAVVAGLAGSVWWVMDLRADNAALRRENASLSRSLATMEAARDQAREAQAVVRAEIERVTAKAKEYDQIREAILRGNNDAELPAWFCDHLGLLGFVCANAATD